MFEKIKVNNRKLNYSKKPEKYDEYVCTLSPKFLEIAERELGETEEVRTKSLKKMREWIANNPNIIACRTDAIFLLCFLRVCKFNVPRACKKLENYLTVRQKSPKWFTNFGIDDEKVRSLFADGYATILPEKDEKGRQVIILRTKYLYPDKFTAHDVMRMTELMTQILLEDEEVQVCGVLAFYDDREITLGHITMWNLSVLREAIQYTFKALPTRATGFHRVYFPAIGRALYFFAKSLMPEKIRQRCQAFKTMDDIKILTNLDVLPKEYYAEAKYGCEEIMREFVKVADSRKQEVMDQGKMCIKIEKKEKGSKKCEKLDFD